MPTTDPSAPPSLHPDAPTNAYPDVHSSEQSYPPVLRLEVRRAARLTHAITLFGNRTQPGDPCFVWMLGRVDEVRAVVASLTREWSEGKLDAPKAADRLRDYLRGLTESLEAFVRSSRAASPAAEVRPPRDMRDTIVDV